VTTPDLDIDELIGKVQANADRLRADAATERAKGNANDPHDEHTREAAQIDWHAAQCERAVDIYHDAVAQLHQHAGPEPRE
jgi:hypothetical protein